MDRSDLLIALSAPTQKNKSQNRGKFSALKVVHPGTTISPSIHHKFTTKNHPRNLWKSQNPQQNAFPRAEKKIIAASKISSNQTTTAPYSEPTPSPHPAPSPPPPKPQTHSEAPASSPQDHPKHSKE